MFSTKLFWPLLNHQSQLKSENASSFKCHPSANRTGGRVNNRFAQLPRNTHKKRTERRTHTHTAPFHPTHNFHTLNTHKRVVRRAGHDVRFNTRHFLQNTPHHISEIICDATTYTHSHTFVSNDKIFNFTFTYK